MDLRDAAPPWRVALHLREHVREEQHLPVARTRDERVLGIVGMFDQKARIMQVGLAAQALQVALPALAVGRIGKHEVELAGRKCVVGQRRVLRPAHDIVGRSPFALEQQVGFGDGVRLGVDLLAIEVDGDLLAALLGDLGKRLLGDRQHSARTASTVVHQVRPGLDLVGDRLENQLRHQGHGIARSPVLASLFVVLFVEPADQFLEDRSHGMVIQAGLPDRSVCVEDRIGTQVHVRREELLDQCAQRVRLGQTGNLVPELEVLEDVLDVRREALKVRFKVSPELLLAGPGPEIP